MPSKTASSASSSGRWMRRHGAALLTASAVLCPVVVGAQQGDSALAETLFQTGKQLMAQGKYEEGCPKLSDSYKLDPAGGTLLALAACHEKQGLTASAWAEYTTAAALAQQQGKAEREKLARARVIELTPLLSRLTVNVPASVASTPGLRVYRGMAEIPRSAWGTATPVDPGSHTIKASAPGRVAWSTLVVVGAKADTKAVEVPELRPEPPPPAAPPAQSASAAPSVASSAPPTDSPPVPPPQEPRSVVPGVVVGGLGLVSLGVGVFFGIQALSKTSKVNEACPDKKCKDADALSNNRAASTAANVANVTIPLGLVGIGIATYLLLTTGDEAPVHSGPSARLVPTVGPGGGGLSVSGRW